MGQIKWRYIRLLFSSCPATWTPEMHPGGERTPRKHRNSIFWQSPNNIIDLEASPVYTSFLAILRP